MSSTDKSFEYALTMISEEPAVRRVREASEAHRLAHGQSCTVYPSSPVMGRILQLLVKMLGAQRVLELGTGLGYSTIWIAKALPQEGRVETVEVDREHTRMAEENFRALGVSDRTKILEGQAEKVLPRLRGPYDLIFDDCTYGAMPEYYEEFPRLLRKGGVLWTANFFVLHDWAEGKREPWISGMHEYANHLIRDNRFQSLILPYLWDGISVRV